MEIKTFRCPECGANFDSSENVTFCSHCGAKLYFDDGTRNINYNYRTENVAQVKEIEAYKEIELKKMKEKSRFLESKWLLNFLTFYALLLIVGGIAIYTKGFGKEVLIVVLLCIAVYVVIYRSLHNKSIIQEKGLQNKVNEIYNDINAGNYEVALIKTKSLHYTEKWSNEIKDKWDDTRESLIKIIEEKMK